MIDSLRNMINLYLASPCILSTNNNFKRKRYNPKLKTHLEIDKKIN